MSNRKNVIKGWLKRFRWMPLVAAGALGSLFLPIPGSAQTRPVFEGIGTHSGGACVTGSTVAATATTPETASFVLTAAPGYISTPDGNSVFMWGYASGNAGFQYPGPVLCVNEGDKVTITLKDTLPVSTSLVFPGLTKVLADGQPVSLDVASGSFAKPAPTGGAVTYQFTAGDPGTFLYESGTNPELQVRMGLAGALIVRPALENQYNAFATGVAGATNPCANDPVLSGTTGTLQQNIAAQEIKKRQAAGLAQNPPQAYLNFVYDQKSPADPAGGCSTAFNAATEFMHLLSEIDPHMHHAIEVQTCMPISTANGGPACTPVADPTYNMTTYLPRYFFINGRSFPDTVTPNYSNSIPTQPYGSLVHVIPFWNSLSDRPEDFNPLPATVRFLNAGPVNYPFHPHSNHDESIGADGRIFLNPTGGVAGAPVNTSIDRFGYVVAPGQTTEALFSWTDAQKWSPDSNPIGVVAPSAVNRADGPYWSGSPYLGVKLPLLNGITQWNQCGEYYHFAHSHDLVHVTNYGAPGGGMLTLIRVDPPPSLRTKYGTSCDGGPGWN